MWNSQGQSMAVILEMPQYVASAFIKISAKSHNFIILCTMDVLSCPTEGCDLPFILAISYSMLLLILRVSVSKKVPILGRL